MFRGQMMCAFGLVLSSVGQATTTNCKGTDEEICRCVLVIMEGDDDGMCSNPCESVCQDLLSDIKKYCTADTEFTDGDDTYEKGEEDLKTGKVFEILQPIFDGAAACPGSTTGSDKTEGDGGKGEEGMPTATSCSGRMNDEGYCHMCDHGDVIEDNMILDEQEGKEYKCGDMKWWMSNPDVNKENGQNDQGMCKGLQEWFGKSCCTQNCAESVPTSSCSGHMNDEGYCQMCDHADVMEDNMVYIEEEGGGKEYKCGEIKYWMSMPDVHKENGQNDQGQCKGLQEFYGKSCCTHNCAEGDGKMPGSDDQKGGESDGQHGENTDHKKGCVTVKAEVVMKAERLGFKARTCEEARRMRRLNGLNPGPPCPKAHAPRGVDLHI